VAAGASGGGGGGASGVVSVGAADCDGADSPVAEAVTVASASVSISYRLAPTSTVSSLKHSIRRGRQSLGRNTP